MKSFNNNIIWNTIFVLLLFTGSAHFTCGFSQDTKGVVKFFQCPTCVETVRIYIDRVNVCKLHERNFSVQEVSPGEHTFCVQKNYGIFVNNDSLFNFSEKRSISINIEAGKIYYVELIKLVTGTGDEYYISEVPDGTYDRVVTKKYKQNKDCK